MRTRTLIALDWYFGIVDNPIHLLYHSWLYSWGVLEAFMQCWLMKQSIWDPVQLIALESGLAHHEGMVAWQSEVLTGLVTWLYGGVLQGTGVQKWLTLPLPYVPLPLTPEGWLYPCNALMEPWGWSEGHCQNLLYFIITPPLVEISLLLYFTKWAALLVRE